MRIDEREIGAALQRIVEASAADETEVSADAVRESFVRFADAGPTQSADRERIDVSIRVRLRESGGWREARATCGSLDEATTRRALARAIEFARVAAPNSDLAPLGGPVEVARTGLDERTEMHGFAEKAAWIRAAVERCRARDLAPAGLIVTHGLVRALESSAGRSVIGATSRASFALTATGARASGFGQHLAARIGDVEPERVVGRAVEKADLRREPRLVEPGEYTVVLEPAAVSALLLFASYQGFGAREVMEQSSFLCGREGEALFPAALTLVDDARYPFYAGLPFDGEGTPRERVELIAGGRLGSPVTDRNTAAKLGVRCTGHSLSQPNTHGPMAQNLVLAPGDRALAELIGGVERGLLVTQLHYTNMIEPRELTLTGMTRNGTFLVERGEVVGPARDLRFTESLVRALGNVSGIGSAQEAAGALFDGEVVTPALRIEGFRFTSTTEP